MTHSSDPTTSSAPDEPATASAEQPRNVVATDMDQASIDSIQHATRDPRFRPGSRQAFFSTELGTRTPRKVDLGFTPTIARSSHEPRHVVEAARLWQRKYKNQCLCIFPNQGWAVEDLWDSTDIRVEGRVFCEQMLTFIGRDTWYTADEFAKDWERAHCQQAHFAGIQIGDVYNPRDPLSALDQIFIFGELTSFPRPFLWHVAFILITDWNDGRWASAPALIVYQNQHLPTVAEQGDSEVEGSSTKVSMPSEKNADDADRSDNASRPDPNEQPKLQSPSQRTMPHVSQISNDLQAHTRYAGVERTARPSTASSSSGTQGSKLQKSSLNMGSLTHNQPQGWIENVSRTISGPHPGQPLILGPGMQQSQCGPPPITLGPQMNVSMIPGSVMGSYVLGPHVLTHPAYRTQPMDPAIGPQGHTNYQAGATRGSHMPPAYMSLSKEPQPVSMADATNVHFPGFMRPQTVDSLAPMPRRLSEQSSYQLFDPYNGTSRKFSSIQGRNDTGRKGGPSNFIAPQNRGRRSSTSSSGRTGYGSHYVPPTSSQFAESSNRWRSSEDDSSITGDSVFGCAHTWIGPKNTTVKELWIGDLPPDVRERELVQLFEKTVDVTPLAISIRSYATKGYVHAFASFASSDDARMALNINQFSPRLRKGEFRPSVSVPKRFYQKDSSPTVFAECSRAVHTADGYVRGTANAPPNGKSTATSADRGMATTNGAIQYSPQDARSGLLKKPQMEATNPTESKSSELENPKPQNPASSKKTKSKSKRTSPIKKDHDAVDVEAHNEKPKVDALPPATIKDNKSNTAIQKNVQDTRSTETHVEPTSNTVQDVCHRTNEKREAVAQPPEQSVQLGSPQSKDSMARSKSPPTYMGAVVDNKPSQPPQNDETTSPSEAEKEAEDDMSDDGAKNEISFHSAPEVQPEAEQIESEAKPGDQVADSDHGTVFATPEIVHNSPLQDSPKALVSAEGSNCETSRGSHPDREQPMSVSSNTEGNSEACKPKDNCDQEERIATNRTHTEANSVKQVATMSAPTKGVSADAVKKPGVQQIQSLHPFATKNKAQAKKEKETKRKQQKKEEADRIAKAKADKADKVASSKKGKSGIDPEPKTEKAPISDTSVATGVQPGQEAATSNAEKHALEHMKKSKSKSKAKFDGTKKEDKRAGGSMEEKMDKSPVDTSPANTSIPQKADKVEAAKTPAVTQDSSTRIETQPESPCSIPSSRALLTPSPTQTDYTQPTRQLFLSRYSSTSTIAGDVNEPTDPSSGPQDTCTGAAVTQCDNTPIETPKKKKKNKRKNKKKKTSIAEPTTTVEYNVNTKNPARVRRSTSEDTHNYDPFTSQMSHIDAIRYNIQHDTTSYFAVTNAEREQEGLKREAKKRDTTNALPQSNNEE